MHAQSRCEPEAQGTSHLKGTQELKEQVYQDMSPSGVKLPINRSYLSSNTKLAEGQGGKDGLKVREAIS